MSLPDKRRDVYHGRLHTSRKMLDDHEDHPPFVEPFPWGKLIAFCLFAVAAVLWALQQP